MTEIKDKVILQVKDKQKIVELPLYGTLQIEIKNGKIISSNKTEKEKYY